MIDEILDLIKQTTQFSKEMKAEFPVRLIEKPALFKCDVAIMTATPQEFDAIIELLENVNELDIENNDSLIYYTATLNTNGKNINVVMPFPVGMGLEAAVISTTKIITHFSPGLIIMSGICAGNKNVTAIGDLIIADKTVNYSSIVELDKAGSTRKKFMQNADSINKNLKSRLTIFANSKTIKTVFEKIIFPPLYTKLPKCHVGLMVTGSSLVRSNEKMAEINDSYHGIKGMDMETHGLYFAASNANKDNPPLFVSMKAVSDFGDDSSHKLSATERTEIALKVSVNSVKLFIEEHFK